MTPSALSAFSAVVRWIVPRVLGLEDAPTPDAPFIKPRTSTGPRRQPGGQGFGTPTTRCGHASLIRPDCRLNK